MSRHLFIGGPADGEWRDVLPTLAVGYRKVMT